MEFSNEQNTIINTVLELIEDLRVEEERVNLAENGDIKDDLDALQAEMSGKGEYALLKQKKQNLRDWFDRQSDDSVKFITTVMYVGRRIVENQGEKEKKSAREIYDLAALDVHQGKQKNIGIIMGKRKRLPEYLTMGINFLKNS